jgi:hypothetical protein
MKLSSLLAQRQALLNQARLANLAYAYQTLSEFAARAGRAGLRGAVTLKSAAPELERYCATLAAQEANQSIVEEHFTDDDLMALADVVAFATGHRSEDALEVHFRIDDIPEAFLLPIRADLEKLGVTLDESVTRIGEQTTG